MGFPGASNQTDEETLRLERLRGDVRQRLLSVISDWPLGDQSEIIEKIVQSEVRHPSDAILKKIGLRLQERI